MPQTREHLAILRLLGLERGVVALTKRDLVDDETAELVRLEVAELRRRRCRWSRCRRAPAPGWTRCARRSTARRPRRRRARRTARCGCRSTARSRCAGSGRWSRAPSGRARSSRRCGWRSSRAGSQVRVRSVQVHDRPVDAAGAGQRVALALVGAERSEAPRGATLATPGALQATYRLECRLDVLPTAPTRTSPRRARDRPPRHCRDPGDRRRARRRRAASGHLRRCPAPSRDAGRGTARRPGDRPADRAAYYGRGRRRHRPPSHAERPGARSRPSAGGTRSPRRALRRPARRSCLSGCARRA